MGKPSSINFISQSHRFLSCYQIWYCYLHTASAITVQFEVRWEYWISQISREEELMIMHNGGKAQWWKCSGHGKSSNPCWWAHAEQSKAVSKDKWANSISILPCCDSLDWTLAEQRLIIISIIFNVVCSASWLCHHEKAVCHHRRAAVHYRRACAQQMRWHFCSTPLHFSNTSKMISQARAKAGKAWQESC